jgi:hypothetical protein
MHTLIYICVLMSGSFLFYRGGISLFKILRASLYARDDYLCTYEIIVTSLLGLALQISQCLLEIVL